MFHDVSATIVQYYHDEGDFAGFQLDLFRKLFVEHLWTRGFRAERTDDHRQGLSRPHWRLRPSDGADRPQALPVISDVFLNQGAQYENIVVPITDGIEDDAGGDQPGASYKSECRELIDSIEKYITLAIIDNEWKEHLREMDELRRSVQNAAIEQKDPLLIYKLESFNLFKAMVDRVNEQVITFLCRAGLPAQQPERAAGAGTVGASTAPPDQPDRSAPICGASRATVPSPRPDGGGPCVVRCRHRAHLAGWRSGAARKEGRAQRSLPCGSGKKYKQCHGKESVITIA
jgi:preprotein translocase subunit SecA